MRLVNCAFANLFAASRQKQEETVNEMTVYVLFPMYSSLAFNGFSYLMNGKLIQPPRVLDFNKSANIFVLRNKNV